jgi:crotonobetainyl-CoA:carnitine CoA-transferase CaiB-like acyl-CoA transferase
MPMSKPFAGIKVLDLTHVIAGPFCAWQFALLGADVVKIENPNEPDCARGRGPDIEENSALVGLNYQVQGTNKRAMAVDIRREEGRSIVLQMARTADVFIENFRTGALAGHGLGYSDLAAVNPRIIYCSLSGYGDTGPRAGINAYDNVIQAASGVISQSADHKPGLSFVDYAAGYNAAFAISAALYRRQREGRGEHVTCSMFETALMLMAPELAATFRAATLSKPTEPGISTYDTAEGKLMLGAFTPRQNRTLWSLLAREGYAAADFAETPDWPSLWGKADVMKSALSEIFLTRTAADWQSLLHANGLPGECVRTLAEAATDPQLAARRFYASPVLAEGEAGTPLPIAAYRFDRAGPSIDTPAPKVGEHTDTILIELGLSCEKIQALRAEGIIV